MQSRKRPEKILLISFGPVVAEIKRYQNKLRRNSHGSRDPLLMKMEALPLFSNRMHGINANLDGYDLILTIGDPLDPVTAKFATDLKIEGWSKTGAENVGDHKKYLEQSDFLNKLDGTIKEFEADFFPGFQMVFALQSNRHSSFQVSFLSSSSTLPSFPAKAFL